MKNLSKVLPSFLVSLIPFGKIFSQGYDIRDYPKVDSIALSNGIIVRRGDNLTLGKGSYENGDFDFVRSNKYLAYGVADLVFDGVVEMAFDVIFPTKNKRHHKYRPSSLDGKYAGQSLEIVRIEERKYDPGTFKKYVLVYYAVLRLKKDWLVEVELENAYKSGEIVF